MKLAKRLLALAMAIAMSFAVASCGDEAEPNTDTTTTVAEQTDTASQEEPTEGTTVAGQTTTAAPVDNGSGLAALPKVSGSTYAAPTDSAKPDASFISGLNGYTLKIKHPWNFGGSADASNKSLQYYKAASNAVKTKYERLFFRNYLS